jgi:hypothetical protein
MSGENSFTSVKKSNLDSGCPDDRLVNTQNALYQSLLVAENIKTTQNYNLFFVDSNLWWKIVLTSLIYNLKHCSSTSLHLHTHTYNSKEF